MDIKIEWSLIKKLWFHSNNGREVIENIWYSIQETSKSTGANREKIKELLTFFIEKGIIYKVSSDPLLYSFTDLGLQIKTKEDLIKTLHNDLN